MSTPRSSLLLAASISLLLVHPAIAQDDSWRTLEFETTEVTAPDVAISPDGQWMIFTMLGKLFRLPVAGGDAEQLTFGPYYDTDLDISPDGTRVAFVSDRDGSEGNVFVQELASGKITQVTHESWAGRPRWTPDGQALVYLRLVREAWRWGRRGRRWGLWSPPPAQVCRVALAGGEPETLVAALADVRSVFHLPDGRVGWATVELDTTVPRATTLIAPVGTTRIEVMGRDGTVSTVRTLDGVVEEVVASPTGNGLYARGWRARGLQHEVVFVPLPEGFERPIVAVSSIDRYNFFGGQHRFAVATDHTALYVGHVGRLWKVTLPRGEREPIPFRAQVTLEVREPVPPPKWTIPAPGRSASPRSVGYPRLSPNGQRLVFSAARYLWEQPLDGGPVRRLSEADAVGSKPAFSPDGSKVAFLHESTATDLELRVFDLAHGQTRSVTTEVLDRSPNWTPDGERLVVVDDPDERSFRLVAIHLGDGTKDTLAEVEGNFLGSGDGDVPISPDGRWMYFVARRVPGHPSIATVFRLSLRDRTARPEPVTQLGLEFSRGRVSPDGHWFSFRPLGQMEIRVVPLGGERVTADDSRLLSPVGGSSSFAFTHDGSAVVYAAANRVWRHPLDGGKREEIPVRLKLQRPTPPPVLLRRVRVLDFVAGGFGPETSLLIQEGRIRWIGAERGPQLPQGTVTIDAAGRFAIPGLFDMHVHIVPFPPAHQEVFLAYGVTSVRDMGAFMVGVSQAADWSTFTREPVPRVFYVGGMLRSPQGAPLPVHVYDEEDARIQVRTQKAWGVQFIKLYVSLPWPLHRAASDEARRLGLPVAAHGTNVEQVVKGVTLGYGALSHVYRPFYDDVLRLLAATGTRWDPTLGWTGRRINLIPRDEPERLDDPKLRAFASEARIRAIRRGLPGVADEELWGRWVGIQRTMRAAYRRGVRLLPGTDYGPAGPAGASLHWELEFFAEAGIPPLEVLRIATQEAAAAVGADEDLGTLEVGKLADIVLLDANPLEDIKNTQTIWQVIKGGWVFDPEALRPERN